MSEQRAEGRDPGLGCSRRGRHCGSFGEAVFLVGPRTPNVTRNISVLEEPFVELEKGARRARSRAASRLTLTGAGADVATRGT